MMGTRAEICGARARWAVFVSGRGSNLLGALDLGAHMDLRLVFSNKSEAPAVRRSRKRGVTVLLTGNPVDWSHVLEQLHRARVNRIALLGFMKLIPASFLHKWKHPIFNLHPSLLPLFPGLRAIENSFAAQEKMGVTLHEVVPEMDSGAIRYQQQTTEFSDNYELHLCEILISKDEQRLVRRLILSNAEMAGQCA